MGFIYFRYMCYKFRQNKCRNFIPIFEKLKCTGKMQMLILWLLINKDLFSIASKKLKGPLLWFLCNSAFHKLFGQWPWNSTQREVPLMTWLSYNKILEKSLGNGSDDKNILFMLLIKTMYLINKLLWNFAFELIIDYQIILSDIETYIC